MWVESPESSLYDLHCLWAHGLAFFLALIRVSKFVKFGPEGIMITFQKIFFFLMTITIL